VQRYYQASLSLLVHQQLGTLTLYIIGSGGMWRISSIIRKIFCVWVSCPWIVPLASPPPLSYNNYGNFVTCHDCFSAPSLGNKVRTAQLFLEKSLALFTNIVLDYCLVAPPRLFKPYDSVTFLILHVSALYS
jgi:hypothetical protein